MLNLNISWLLLYSIVFTSPVAAFFNAPNSYFRNEYMKDLEKIKEYDTFFGKPYDYLSHEKVKNLKELTSANFFREIGHLPKCLVFFYFSSLLPSMNYLSERNGTFSLPDHLNNLAVQALPTFRVDVAQFPDFMKRYNLRGATLIVFQRGYIGRHIDPFIPAYMNVTSSSNHRKRISLGKWT
jgi:hypothetical protein